MSEYMAEFATPHGPKRAYIDAEQTATPALVHELSAHWVRIAQINPNAINTLRIGILRLSEHMGSELGFDHASSALSDLRRRHLDAWEGSLLGWQAKLGTDHPYRVAVYMFAFLHYIEDRQPGTLDPQVYARVLQPTRLSHIRRDPLADFSEGELTAIKAAIRTLTYDGGQWTMDASADVMIAFHAALCISTGEPPDVLRALKIDDISASSADARSAGLGTEQIAAARLADSYTVVLRKNRAHTVEEVTWRRTREPVTVRYLDALIELGSPLRHQTGDRSLWMMRDAWGRAKAAPWGTLNLDEWIERHVDEVISTPRVPGRFRKSAIAAEIIAEPARHLRTQRRHTQDMLFDHYTNSPDLRKDAGARFVRSIEELRDRALGPTIDAGDGVVQLDPTTSQVTHLDGASLPESVGGALTGCRNPEDSPHAPRGEVCPMSRMGTCFTCPNAIITTEHLPALILVNSVSAPDSAADPTTWQKVWGVIHEATTTILQMFPRAALNEAQRHTDDVLVDLGLRHEMRGPADG